MHIFWKQWRRMVAFQGQGRWSNGTQVDIQTGKEGPSYDPYHWTRITVKRLGYRVQLHMGLGIWLEFSYSDHNGQLCTRHMSVGNADVTEEEILMFFIESTGAEPGQWMHWYMTRIYVPDPMGSLSNYE